MCFVSTTTYTTFQKHWIEQSPYTQPPSSTGSQNRLNVERPHDQDSIWCNRRLIRQSQILYPCCGPFASPELSAVPSHCWRSEQALGDIVTYSGGGAAITSCQKTFPSPLAVQTMSGTGKDLAYPTSLAAVRNILDIMSWFANSQVKCITGCYLAQVRIVRWRLGILYLPLHGNDEACFWCRLWRCIFDAEFTDLENQSDLSKIFHTRCSKLKSAFSRLPCFFVPGCIQFSLMLTCLI